MDEETKVDETVETEEVTTTTQTEEATQEAATEQVETTEPSEETETALYDLPDGRKVDAVTLQKEWKENFLPEFTRKSQELASIKGGTKETHINKEETRQPWQDDEYQPQTWGEVINAAKEEVKREQAMLAQQERQRLEQVESMVQSQLDEIKKAEPNIDENSLFAHATKYGFNDLTNAFSNMQDMKKVVLKTERRVQENLKRRADEPVATGGSQTSSDDGYDPVANSQFSGALDYLKSIKK